jgi:hypothetical protein
MISIYKADFFNIASFDKIKNCVFEKIKDLGLSYGKEFKRYYRIVFLPKEIQDMLLDEARKEIGDDSLEVIYTQIVKYQIKDGEVPELRKHKDIVTGEWVMDIVIDATIDWPLVIEGENFSNQINSVSFIKGEEDLHWRPDFPSTKEEDYLLLLFVHLAKKDSEYYRISKQFHGMKESTLNSFLEAMNPSWAKTY